MKPFYIIGYLLIAVVLGSVSDGLNDDGLKVLGHSLEALEILLLISGAFLLKLSSRDWVPYLVTYISFRILGFDYLYNLTRGLPWSYLGSSSYWDLFFVKQYPGGILFARVIFGILGVSLPFKYMKESHSLYN